MCSFPSINAYMAQVLLVGADLPTLLRATDSDLEAQFPWVPQRFLVRHTSGCRNDKFRAKRVLAWRACVAVAVSVHGLPPSIAQFDQPLDKSSLYNNSVHMYTARNSYYRFVTVN